MLRECQQRFGAAPRDFGDAEKRHLKVAFSWLVRIVSRSDALCQPLIAQRNVFRNGTIVWGHVIQANAGLYQPDRRNMPGEVVYSLSNSDLTPVELASVAAQLYSLKGTRPATPGLRRIADYLSDEFERVFGLSVPATMSRDECLISTIQFARPHLPHQMLVNNAFPIVVSPQPPHHAFILPAVYWPDRLLQLWGAERPFIQ